MQDKSVSLNIIYDTSSLGWGNLVTYAADVRMTNSCVENRKTKKSHLDI